MLELFQSNKMAALVKALAERSQQFADGPFEPATVVVQSFGIGQWLKLQLAEDRGIAANIECILPADLIWRLYESFIDPGDLPPDSPFSRELLTWRLMRLLPGEQSKEFGRVQDYLEGPGDPQIRLYQLSEQIAGLYDQYLVYRPHWMTAWDEGKNPVGRDAMKDQAWQYTLWRDLLRQPGLPAGQHRAHLHELLLDAVRRCSSPPAELPRHISILGLSSLPPMHLDALRAVARIIDVDIYFLNPCEHYWGDIVSRKDMARRTIRELTRRDEPLTDEDYLEVGNPLLSSMGKQGREFFELLLSIDEIESADAFLPTPGNSMLAFVQNDILRLEFGGHFSSDGAPRAQPVHAEDRSIQIHSCHSKLREVEVLYDQLLGIIADDSDIKPGDIMVMMPGVADYAPYIHAVFKAKLPYSVADRAPGEESPILISFARLLDLPHSRLTSVEVMDLLEVPVIARRFGLDEDDLSRLAARIDEAGIRFELDGASKQRRWNLPPGNQNTWKFGLDRMLAGYAMDSADELYEGILPVDVEGGDARLLGTLCHFIDLLAHYREELSVARVPAEWLHIIDGLVADFFLAEGDEELDLDAIFAALDRLVEQTVKTDFPDEVSPALFSHWIARELDKPVSNRAFITGGITFGTLIPMRSIPFKVICLLGMNDNEYPRQSKTASFDLMLLEGERKGDRSRRNDDRYLFLEALISAQRYFYVSYEGRSLKDNSEKTPSVLVSELMDYCRAVFDRDCRTEHRLQPFNPDYFDPARPDLKTWRHEWYEALTHTEPRQPFIDSPLPATDDGPEVDLEELVQFYRHPARYFLRYRLGVYFQDDDVRLRESEPFSLDGIEKYQLADAALRYLIGGKSREDWQALMIASGQVMDNAVGREHLDREFDHAAPVFETIEEFLLHEPASRSARIDIDGMELVGRIDNLFGDIQLDYRTGELRRRQLLQAWVRHLFLNACGDSVQTLMVNRRKPVRLLALEPEVARAHLARLLGYFKSGLCRPLPLIPETSFSFAEAIEKGESVEAASKTALRSWFSDSPGSESRDPDYRRCFQFPESVYGEFREISLAIAGPVLGALEP